MKLKRIIKNLPKPNYTSKKLIKNQTTGDIIKELIKSNELYNEQGKLIAPYFDKGNDINKINSIYEFMKNELIYEIEPEDYQTSRSPLRILWDNYKGTGIDCKSYALLSASILSNLTKPIPYKFRFVSYSPLSDVHHVYTMAKINNKWYPIDPLQKSPEFKEKNYIFVKDKKPKINNMLARLSGIGVSKFQNAALKPVTAFSRNAFLLVVSKNMANVGGQLVKAYNSSVSNMSKINEWWYGLGGSVSALKKAMAKVNPTSVQYTGVKPPPVFEEGTLKANEDRAKYCREKYPKKLSINRPLCEKGIISSIGEATTGTAATLTAAASVIASLGILLSSLGVADGTKLVSKSEEVVEFTDPEGTDTLTASVPLPLILVLGGSLLYLLFVPTKKSSTRRRRTKK